MRTMEERAIDGNLYAVSQLPGSRGLEMFGKLAGLLGPAALEAIAKGASLEKDLQTLAPAAVLLFSRLQPGDLSAIAKELLGPASVNGTPLEPTFETHFQGRILHLLKVMVFAVEVNYRDFFAALGGLGALLKAPGNSAGSATSSGPSGA
jgi:hypothetical protein